MRMAGPDVAALAADLARAVELTMSVNASQADRLKAYNACESFKETSPLCAEAGLYLAAGTQHSLVSRHFGLQLMEHTVKYRWTQISQQEKLFIKVRFAINMSTNSSNFCGQPEGQSFFCVCCFVRHF